MLKFTRIVKKLSFDSQIIIYEELNNPEGFRLAATKLGITFMGNSSILRSVQDLAVLAEAVGSVWKDHQILIGGKDGVQDQALEAPAGGDEPDGAA